MADIPVNEYRLLEIERLLARVPTAEIIADILALGVTASTLLEEVLALKTELRIAVTEAQDAAKAFDDFHGEYVVRQNALGRRIDGYLRERKEMSDPYWLGLYRLLEQDE